MMKGMRTMKRFLIFALSFWWLSLCFLLTVSAQEVEYEFVQSKSTFRISGTSTLHDWECTVENWKGDVVLNGDLPGIKNVTVVVPVEGIDCKKKAMNEKLFDALKYEAYPNIEFVFLQLDSAKKKGNEYELYVKGRLTVAGKSQVVPMRVRAKQEQQEIRFVGEKSISMKSFNIDPPTAMLGVLKTGDVVTVHFDVVARKKKTGN